MFLFSFITRGLNRKFASRPPVREVFKIFIEFLISAFIVSWLCLGVGYVSVVILYLCRDHLQCHPIRSWRSFEIYKGYLFLLLWYFIDVWCKQTQTFVTAVLFYFFIKTKSSRGADDDVISFKLKRSQILFEHFRFQILEGVGGKVQKLNVLSWYEMIVWCMNPAMCWSLHSIDDMRAMCHKNYSRSIKSSVVSSIWSTSLGYFHFLRLLVMFVDIVSRFLFK